MVDVGTGDGRFVANWARAHPQGFAIGVDAVAEAMRRASRRAAAKPSRGGLPNALFVRAALEELPGFLAAVADQITVHYPWGSLLRALAAPDVASLRALAALGKPGARLKAVINLEPLLSEARAARLRLAGAALVSDTNRLCALYREAGFIDVQTSRSGATALPATAWGRRLGAAGRAVIVLSARKLVRAAPDVS